MSEDYEWHLIPGKGKLPAHILFLGFFEVKPMAIFGLNPGDKIIQVGKKFGGMDAVNRIDDFVSYVEYVGVREEKMPNDNNATEFLIFKLNDAENPYKNDPAYVAYIIINSGDLYELKVPCIGSNTNRIYKPFFKLIP